MRKQGMCLTVLIPGKAKSRARWCAINNGKERGGKVVTFDYERNPTPSFSYVDKYLYTQKE